MISKEGFRDAVIAGIKAIKGVDTVAIGDDEEFSNAGLDSLEGMNLVLEVEALTGLNFGEFDLADANTINAFYKKAQELSPKQ
jgi:acyl carrier protein